ncbi:MULTISPECIES: DUF2750 domain-containing protein [Paenibacillus]|nr:MULTISPECIES: DUF2750 domain-containing protein [Paenibacillus]
MEDWLPGLKDEGNRVSVFWNNEDCMKKPINNNKSGKGCL